MNVRRQNHISHRILLIITRMEDEKKVGKVFKRLQLPIYYQCRGKGTANSELLNICGLQGTTRLITISILSRVLAEGVLEAMSRKLYMERRGCGIAITIPVDGMQDAICKILEQKSNGTHPEGKKGDAMEMEHKDAAYSMILVAANYGYSDEIINAARKAGAKGGTVIKGRRRGSENVMKFLGVTTQEEQEFTMIIVSQSQKTDVIVEINQACGLKTAAHGVILSIPVEEMLGIEV